MNYFTSNIATLRIWIGGVGHSRESLGLGTPGSLGLGTPATPGVSGLGIPGVPKLGTPGKLCSIPDSRHCRETLGLLRSLWVGHSRLTDRDSQLFQNLTVKKPRRTERLTESAVSLTVKTLDQPRSTLKLKVKP